MTRPVVTESPAIVPAEELPRRRPLGPVHFIRPVPGTVGEWETACGSPRAEVQAAAAGPRYVKGCAVCREAAKAELAARRAEREARKARGPRRVRVISPLAHFMGGAR